MAKELYVFSTPACGACKMVEQQLNEAGIEFNHIDCADGTDETADLVEKCQVRGSVPVTVLLDNAHHTPIRYWKVGSGIDIAEIKSLL